MGLKKAIVITPTTGAPELRKAIDSVVSQTYDTEHLIVCDGSKYADQVKFTVGQYPDKVKACYLPFNTGGNGFYGHRIMAAFSHLIDHDYVLFLDQDNWFDPNHVETMVNEIEQFNVDWTHSLRKIYDKDGELLVAYDNCESLGRWPVWVKDDAYLVDSSSYCFKRDFIRNHGHYWDWGWGADRRFYTIIKDHLKHQNYTCTGLHTLNYRLGGNEGSVNADFFHKGNAIMKEKYGEQLPWVATFL